MSSSEHYEESEHVHMRRQIEQMSQTLRLYRELADAVQNARVMDFSIYGDRPDSEEASWLSIDRDDYNRMMQILAKLDLWKPWNQVIPHRIGPP